MEFNDIIYDINKQHKINNILHIGACLGNEIDFYKTLNPKIIYWFEPNQSLIDGLKKRVHSDTFISEVFQVAVSNKNGIQKFNIIEDDAKTNPGCSSLNDLKLHSDLYPNIKLVETCEVKTVILDDFLFENNLNTEFDMVVMDTQGHDYYILSSSKIIFNSKIIIVETAKIELYEGQKLENEVDAILKLNGYNTKHYHEYHQVWGDSLYIKD